MWSSQTLQLDGAGVCWLVRESVGGQYLNPDHSCPAELPLWFGHLFPEVEDRDCGFLL